MNSKIQNTIIAGIVGTAVMTLVMMIAPMMGMPHMSPPSMLSTMLGAPLFVGWIMHFLIGCIFAYSYSYLRLPSSLSQNLWLRGAIFGVTVFIVAQIAMAIMGLMLPIPEVEGSVSAIMVGSLLGHIVYGMTVARVLGTGYGLSRTSAS